jgi:hypothetical protein
MRGAMGSHPGADGKNLIFLETSHPRPSKDSCHLGAVDHGQPGSFLVSSLIKARI